jgi:cysteine-rich repeat protein
MRRFVGGWAAAAALAGCSVDNPGFLLRPSSEADPGEPASSTGGPVDPPGTDTSGDADPSQGTDTQTADASTSGETTAPGTDSEPPTLCGNGLLDPGEACDDGDQQPGDGCEAFCRPLFAGPELYEVMEAVTGVAAGDFDKDGLVDLVFADPAHVPAPILVGIGAGKLAPFVGAPFAAELPLGNVVALDLDGAHGTDIIGSYVGAGNVVAQLKLAPDDFAGLEVPLGISGDSASLRLGDLNGDGLPDAVIVDADDQTLSHAINMKNGAFGLATARPIEVPALRAAVGEVDGEPGADVVVTYDDQGGRVVLYPRVLDQDDPVGPTALPGAALGVVVTEVGDGPPAEVVVADPAQGRLVVLSYVDDALVVDAAIPVGAAPVDVLALELRGPGTRDLVSLNAESGDVSVVPLGDELPPAGHDYPAVDGALAAAAADLDGDGDLDLAVVAGDGRVAVLKNRRIE